MADPSVDLVELGRLLEAATAGEWRHTPICRNGELIEDRVVVRHARGPATIIIDDVVTAADAEAIVALRNHAPALLAEMTRLREEREAYREALQPFASFAETFVDEEGWSGPMKQERIVDWFGPSDFRLAASTLAGERT